MPDSTDQPFAGYPKNYLLGIIDDRQAASRAESELRALGMEDVQLLTGEAGAEELDSDGSEHGFFGTLVRSIERVSAEIDHLREYEQAVREGAAVVAAYVEDDALRAQATEVMRKYDARFVNYFGAMTVELVVR